jgi:hypothetical protein
LLLIQVGSAQAVQYGVKTWTVHPSTSRPWDSMGGTIGSGTGSGHNSNYGLLWANSGWAWLGTTLAANLAWDTQTHYYNCQVHLQVWDTAKSTSSGSNTSSYLEVIDAATWTYIVPNTYHLTQSQWAWERSSKFTPGEYVYVRQIDSYGNNTKTLTYVDHASMTCDYWYDWMAR